MFPRRVSRIPLAKQANGRGRRQDAPFVPLNRRKRKLCLRKVERKKDSLLFTFLWRIVWPRQAMPRHPIKAQAAGNSATPPTYMQLKLNELLDALDNPTAPTALRQQPCSRLLAGNRFFLRIKIMLQWFLTSLKSLLLASFYVAACSKQPSQVPLPLPRFPLPPTRPAATVQGRYLAG